MVVNKINIDEVRKDFPILSRQINGKPLIYFDNAATTQKPKQVIDSLVNYYGNRNANIHRGVHQLSQDATVAYENARTTVQQFINAKYSHEIIFTKGTTDSINLVSNTLSKLNSPFEGGQRGMFISPGDEIIISAMEHHSNIIPWQVLCEEKGAVLKVIPIHENGELLIDEFKKLLTPKTKLVALTHVSNTLGTINPIKEIISLVRNYTPLLGREALILIDGAQAIPHMPVDVQDLDCDFYCFSAHKLYGPTGVGILYGKEKTLNVLPPYQVGGGVIKTVTFEKTEYADLPLKFEAGTPHIEGGIGLAAAINYVNEIGINNIASYEEELLKYATEKLKQIDGLKIIGTANQKASVISFVIEGLHPFDIGTLLDKQGIAVRTGHHCTQPLMQFYNIPGTIRASFSFYNTKEEIDVFISALNKTLKMLR